MCPHSNDVMIILCCFPEWKLINSTIEMIMISFPVNKGRWKERGKPGGLVYAPLPPLVLLGIRRSFPLAIELSISIYGRFKGTHGKIDSCGLRCSLSSWFGIGRKMFFFFNSLKMCTLIFVLSISMLFGSIKCSFFKKIFYFHQLLDEKKFIWWDLTFRRVLRSFLLQFKAADRWAKAKLPFCAASGFLFTCLPEASLFSPFLS